MQQQLDARLLAHLVQDDLEALGIEVDAPDLQRLLPPGRAVEGVHPLGDLAQDALDDGEVGGVRLVRQDRRDKPGGGQPAHEAVALDQDDFRAVARGCDGRRYAARPAAADDDVGLGDDRDFSRGFVDGFAHGGLRSGCLSFGGLRGRGTRGISDKNKLVSAASQLPADISTMLLRTTAAPRVHRL